MRILGIVLLLALTGGDAAALVACKTRAGQVVVRDTCRRKETRIALGDLGAQGPSGAMGAAGAAGRAALYLLDAGGIEVGPIVRADEEPFFATPGTVYVLALIRNDQIGGAALIGASVTGAVVGQVSYASTDCSGTPLVDGKTFLPVLQVIVDTVFRPLQPAGAVTVRSMETSDQSLGCTSVTSRGGCCRTLGATPNNLLSTTSSTTLSGLGLHPPFHVSGR